MNAIEMLKKEHEEIERELIELETIMSEDFINYPNLAHTFRKLIDLWNIHEVKEEKVFSILKHAHIVIPVETMKFQHQSMKMHKEAIERALNSRSEYEMKKALHVDGTIIIAKIRKHIKFEDEILYTITLKQFSAEELKELYHLF